ncbi:MAG: tRNA pseudouridine(38-40) synthase TruA [Campylobacterales bacterium]
MIVKGVVSYDGSRFFGMQRQSGVPTVEGAILAVLSRLGIESGLEYAGRTDRGVHGLNQVVSFQIPQFWRGELSKLQRELNRLLFPSIQFKKLEIAPPNFHPRHWALKRSYRYLFRTNFSPFWANYSYTPPESLNLQLLNRGAQLFIGEHNFYLFSKRGSNPRSYIRKIYTAHFFPYRRGLVVFRIVGNGFLRAQVRLIVGALLELNRGGLTFSQIREQLAGDRLHFSTPAPPAGLYLERVWYPL